MTKKSNIHLALAAAVIGLTASFAGAQAMGPDVIVGALPNISNYSHSGGIDAFAVGTTSCNIGTTNLAWISNTNQHPVIGQNAYRLHNGRFEQIGQSWLKHGFFALSETLCGSCPIPTDGSSLGVGCSDPYDSSLNGSQSGLGPKYQVDAFSGNFVYPPAAGTGSGSTFKRLQVALTDLNQTTYAGAKWYVDAQYVHPQDAAFGNHFNNASWREVQYAPNGGGFNMSFAAGSTTHQQQPAIFAWKAEDPSVSLIPVNVPGEGRFYAALKVSSIGGGLFHWEVAVHNLNSNLSAREFSIEFPAGATVSNIGFHDVDYHSGEPFVGTDWTNQVVGNNVVWSTQTFAQNSNANALRWGTLYNFRFDCDQAPTSGFINGSLGLFLPVPSPTVNFTWTPPTTLVSVSGNNQFANAGEAFGQPIVVRTETLAGAAVAGVPVSFSLSSGSVSFSSATNVVSDANGLAQVSLQALPTYGGPITLKATTSTSELTFNLYARRLAETWVPGPGIAVFSLTMGQPSVPFVLGIDVPPVTPTVTPFGTLYTSVLSPSPSLVLVGAAPGATYFDATYVTNTIGGWSKVYTGLTSIAGSGLQYVYQAYAYYIDGTGGHFYFSNPWTQTY